MTDIDKTSSMFARAKTSPRYPALTVAGQAGTSFKPEHLGAIVAERASRGFFEVHAENYMGAGGPPHRALDRVRRDHPISLHGVCMSLGGSQPLDKEHLARFKRLVDRYEAALVSDAELDEEFILPASFDPRVGKAVAAAVAAAARKSGVARL